MNRNSKIDLILAVIVILGCLALIFPIITSLGALSDTIDQVTCEHKNQDNVPTKYTQDSHTYNVACEDCGEVLKKDQNGAHTWDLKGVCTFCKYTCTHKEFSSVVSQKITDTHHQVVSKCKYCRYNLVTQETHIWSVTGYCKDCGAANSTVSHKHTFVEDVCSTCGYCCTHQDGYTATLTYVAENGHGGKYYCEVCGVYVRDFMEKHNYENGVCKSGFCSWRCKHMDIDQNVYESKYEVISIDHYQHHCLYTCLECNGEISSISSIQYHNFNEDGVCTECQYETCGCDADNPDDVEYVDYIGSDGHGTNYVCSHGSVVAKDREEHTYVNGVCKDCGFEKP